MAQNVTGTQCSALARTLSASPSSRRRADALKGIVCAILFLSGGGFGARAEAQTEPVSTHASDETVIFPRIRRLELPEVRALATKRSSTIALADAKAAGTRADLKELQNRFKIGTAGGLGIGSSPFESGNRGGIFSPKVRLYLSLDLERLLQLNKQQRVKAQQAIEAEDIGHLQAVNAAIRDVSGSWFALRKAETSVVAAARYRETASALYVAADARFKAGDGQLSSVLSALDGTYKSDEAFSAARQAVALACLDLAQSCGYSTAEEMEAALT